jgi:hypothetical protein
MKSILYLFTMNAYHSKTHYSSLLSFDGLEAVSRQISVMIREYSSNLNSIKNKKNCTFKQPASLRKHPNRLDQSLNRLQNRDLYILNFRRVLVLCNGIRWKTNGIQDCSRIPPRDLAQG